MNKEEIVNFIKDYLRIKIYENNTPTTCGGECQGNYGIKVELLLDNPLTGKLEQIDWDKCDL